MKTGLQAAGTGLIGLVVFGLMLFLPAWTFNYWQAWVFIAVFTISTGVPSIYLSLKNPAALERRMHAGPAAETRTVQKFIITSALLSLPAVMVFSAFDHRFGWSPVPTAVSVIGDALVAIGLGIAMLVVIQIKSPLSVDLSDAIYHSRCSNGIITFGTWTVQWKGSPAQWKDINRLSNALTPLAHF
jgi:hypothetical protein